jgi:hypothetical protein
MSPSTGTKPEAVPPEEVARRIAEYRRQGFERKTMPHIIYHGTHIACPWPCCGYQIAGIDFQLENYDTAFHNQALAAWWQGPGLVGRCPGCGQLVLFDFNGKQTVADPNVGAFLMLPDDWYQKAYIL